MSFNISQRIPTPRKSQFSHRMKFTNVEDKLLITLVAQFGTNNWNEISKRMIGRTSKQCKDHYLNNLRPCNSKLPFSPQEDQIIIQKYYEFGPKWTKMTNYLPSRSANAIKNRWNCFLSKNFISLYQEKQNIETQDENMLKGIGDMIFSDEISFLTQLNDELLLNDAENLDYFFMASSM